MSLKPSYLDLYKSGEIHNRIKALNEMLSDCTMCARNCHTDRNKTTGWCNTGIRARVSSYSPHFGEESPLVGLMGSGTIFFSYCNLGCIFCQNYNISHKGEGKELKKEGLADIMIRLQKKGCHNINLVSPSHVVAQIVEALPIAIENGLDIPLVYNTGGYDSPETLKLLDGIIDIYMPDMKFASNERGLELSASENYWDVCKQAVKIMHDQVGDLIIENNIAKKGLLVRHLILPDDITSSRDIFEFLSTKISKHTYLNIMDQYYPAYEACHIDKLNRRITMNEYKETVALARSYGLTRLD